MPAFEKKLIIWLQKHMDVLLMTGTAALALLVRYSLCSLHADIPDSGLNKLMIFADILLAVSVYLLLRTCEKSGKKSSGTDSVSAFVCNMGRGLRKTGPLVLSF